MLVRKIHKSMRADPAVIVPRKVPTRTWCRKTYIMMASATQSPCTTGIGTNTRTELGLLHSSLAKPEPPRPATMPLALRRRSCSHTDRVSEQKVSFQLGQFPFLVWKAYLDQLNRSSQKRLLVAGTTRDQSTRVISFFKWNRSKQWPSRRLPNTPRHQNARKLVQDLLSSLPQLYLLTPLLQWDLLWLRTGSAFPFSSKYCSSHWIA
jgi:hypothetical protein